MSQPAAFQPLTFRGELWRYLLCLLVSALSFPALYAGTEELTGQTEWDGGLILLDIALGIAAFVAVHWRRKYPVAIAVTIALAGIVSGFAAGPGLLAFVSLCTRRRWPEMVPVYVVALGASAANVWLVPSDLDPFLWAALGAYAGILALLALWGMYIGSRRELLRTLRARAESAEAEQEAKLATARADERTRIARDMHDAMAHRLSMVALHAGALSYRNDLDAQEVRRSAEVIRTSTHAALEELRETLSALRDADDGEPNTPQRTAPEIVTLIAECRSVGMNITEHISVDLVAVPAALSRTLYRVTQELLTNARKHAPNTAVDLTLTGKPGTELYLRVTNPPGRSGTLAAPVSGYGLAGIGERVRLSGGRFTTATGPDRRFIAEARLPWPS